jgi:hypothetical protein
LEVKLLDDPIERPEQSQTQKCHARACGAKPGDPSPEECCHDRDVNDVGNPDLCKREKHDYRSGSVRVR